jgi:hypothetical protein
VKHGAASSINAANGQRIKGHQPFLSTSRIIIGIEVERTGPTATKADDLPSKLLSSAHDRLNTGVQSRDIAPTGQDSNTHFSPKLSFCSFQTREAHDLTAMALLLLIWVNLGQGVRPGRSTLRQANIAPTTAKLPEKSSFRQPLGALCNALISLTYHQNSAN